MHSGVRHHRRRKSLTQTGQAVPVEMRVLTSLSGQEETVTPRRSESADAERINSLIGPSAAAAVFGRVNVIHLLEKANLAVTLANEKDDIVAHASFFDHPVAGLVDSTEWEPYLQRHFGVETLTPLNTLFLHLFVAQPDFAPASVKEIMRAIFDAVVELEHVCLLSPHVGPLGPGLDEALEPLPPLIDPEPQCSAFICNRQQHCPRLLIRPARVEDHDDMMHIFVEQTKPRPPVLVDHPFFLSELIEAQDERNQMAVCESDGSIVGFLSVTSEVDLTWLCDFELSELDVLHKQTRPEETVAWDESGEEDEGDDQTSEWLQDETQPPRSGPLPEETNTFSIQLFVIDKNHEMRSADFIPYVFTLFPELDFCLITVPTLSPEFPLLQSFVRIPRRVTSSLSHELYVFHRAGLSGVVVRPAAPADQPAVSDLVTGLSRSELLLQDLDGFYRRRRDPDGRPLQVFVAQVQAQVVAVLILRDEQDVEYLRAHYNIENFVYFSHHRYEEHAQLRHLVIRPFFQHFAKHLFKEVLRLAHKSCLHHRIYPSPHSQENSCVHHLDFVLHCAVPVRPRRQIIYPLEELGMNAPSRQITQDQAPFALSLISRKLTMEPKVAVNARIVVVGASDTGLSFLEVLSLCPHLKFNNLTLISTHGFPGDYSDQGPQFLSTSHGYSSADLAQLPLRSCITVVTGKMVAIDRKSKHVCVCDGRTVPYDHLILCTGLQYQVPRPSGVEPSQPAPRRVPSNLFTLNEPWDCRTTHRWLQDHFVGLQDNAIVYGNSIDVYTTVEALLSLRIQGRHIHVVLTPSEDGAPCFSDLKVEKAVAATMKKAKVRVHHNCLLAQMNDGEEEPELLTSVTFTTNAAPLRLQCGVFINLSNKGVDYDTFRSINNSFLVFDSRLVISTAFCTSDTAICGAGPLTKFSLCYHADEWSHASFNSKEVGQDLAAMLLSLYDPTQEPADEPSPDADLLVPLYRHAKVQGGKLPGGYHYLHVTKPCTTSRTGPALNPSQERSIMTGRVERGNYFHLHLDSYELVGALTCFSLKPLPVNNYLSLFGKHQQLLSQLSTRYQQGLIRDLYSFFRQSWCLAVYHDRFSDFEQELQQIVSTTDKQADAERRAALGSSTVKYLTYNRNLLPMFAYPGQL